MPLIDASKLRIMFMDCLDSEVTEDSLIIEGVLNKFALKEDKVKSYEEEIKEMLSNLPEEFREDGESRGWSFLQACVDKSNDLWGQHRDIEHLLVLALAVGRATILLPRERWSILPGGVPYFSVRID